MKKSLLALTAAAIFLPMSASAVMLTGAGTTDFALNGTTSAAEPQLAGTVLQDLITPFTISGAGENLSGTIQNRVVRSVDGTLDFYWRIIPDSGTGDINAFRLTGFDGYTLNANYRTDGLGDIGPDTAKYFGDGTGSVNFLFSNGGPGSSPTGGGYTTSLFFFLDTNATSYDKSGQFDMLCADTGCISQLYSTFAPSAVPIPAAIWLFGSGLIGMIGFARRKSS